jgi:flagellar motor switch protein FliG
MSLAKVPPSGSDLAAVVLLTIGDALAAEVVRHMDERAIGLISASMSRLNVVDKADVAHALGKLSFDREAPGEIASGGLAFLRRVLSSAFDDRMATEMIERILRSGSGSLDALSTTDPKVLVEHLGNECPQIIAVIIGHMPRSAAVGLLSQLPEAVTIEAIYRYAKLEVVQPVALQELRAMLAEILGAQVTSQMVSPGGIRHAGDLLNGMETATSQKALDAIRKIDPEMADQIRESMFTFEDLIRLSDDAMQMTIREFQQRHAERLDQVLRGATPEMCKRVYSNISSKQAAALRDQVENGKALTRSEVQLARRDFVNITIELANEKKISLTGSEEMV